MILFYLIIINAAAFGLMYYDKYMAQTGQWRVPERILFYFVLAGGGIGGCVGMKVFHHKTRKSMFLVGFPAIAIVEYILLLMGVIFL